MSTHEKVIQAARDLVAKMSESGVVFIGADELQAAITAHDAAGKVEWVAYGAGVVHQAHVGHLLLHVEPAAFGSVGFGPKSTAFRWKVVLEADPRGTAPTLELAKAAATEAARGAK